MKREEYLKLMEDFKEENIDCYGLVDFYYAVSKYREFLIDKNTDKWKDDLERRQKRRQSYENEKFGLYY